MHESDRTAVASAASGDRDAFRSLVERHSRHVFAVAYRMTGNVEDAEDIVQTTFLKAFKQIGRFEARADVKTWLHRITVNSAIDLIRTRQHREVGQDPDTLDQAEGGHTEKPASQPDQLYLSAEIRDRVAQGMAQLTANERAAFTLRHLEGMSIREVATAMGLRTEAAKNSIFRAVRKMRATLAPFVELSEPRV